MTKAFNIQFLSAFQIPVCDTRNFVLIFNFRFQFISTEIDARPSNVLQFFDTAYVLHVHAFATIPTLIDSWNVVLISHIENV